MQKVAAARIFGPVADQLLSRPRSSRIPHETGQDLYESVEAFTRPLLAAYIYIYIFTLLTTRAISARYCYVVVVVLV